MVDKNKLSKYFDNEWNDKKDLRFDYFNRKINGINNENCPVILFDIISLFARDCDYKLNECYLDSKRLFINGIYRKEKSELMLRFAGVNNELVVARVCFINRRCGNMTELYKILKYIQKKYKTGKIVIESVMTEEMKQWCEKNGFKKLNESNCYSDI